MDCRLHRDIDSRVLDMLKWFTSSNRWLHFLGGLTIGLFSDDWFCAALSGIGIASSLELKDVLYGKIWDTLDWCITLFSVLIGFYIRVLLRFI